MKALRLRSNLLALLGAVVLAACASFDGLQPSGRPIDPAALRSTATLAALPADVDGWPSSAWWKAYGDAQLDALVGETLAGNPTLAIARARIEQAEALVSAADASGQPQLGAGASLDRQRYPDHGIFPPPIAGASLTTATLALSLRHEFDFWGRQRAALEAALSRARAAAIEAEAAKLALVAALAGSYIELDHQCALLELAEATLRQREKIRELTGSRVAAGLETELELRQSAASVFAARTELAVVRERLALLRNALAALAGQGPDRGLAIVRPRLGAGPAASLPGELPAVLLGRRPDLVAQRLRVEAAAGDIAEARARFYPNVNLTAALGLQSVGLERLLQAGSRTFEAGAALSLPIFDGGRLRANLAVRDADYDLAVEQYNGTLVEALREVADQINSWRAIDLQSAEQSQAGAEAEAAHRLALLRYRAGLASYLAVLGVESQVLAQQRLGADLRARRLAASVGLSRALGGGFQGSPAALPTQVELQSVQGISK